MLELITSVVFILLAVLMFTGFIANFKKKQKRWWMYLSFSIVSLLIGILLFSFSDWDFSKFNGGENNDSTIIENGNGDKTPGNDEQSNDDGSPDGTGSESEREEPEEQDQTDQTEPDPNDSTPPESEEPGTPEPPSPEPTDTETPVPPEPVKITIPDDGVVEYRVVKGDTLSAISRRADVTVAKIKQWNNLSSDTIFVGQVLKLYGKNNEPAPPPSPSDPDGGSPSKVIRQGNTQQKKIALTFDAGSDLIGIEVLDIMKRYDVKATFFLEGAWVERYPHHAKRIANEGHEIGNHTYSHPRATEISSSALIKDIQKGERTIQSVTGVSPRPYFRFPYGAFNNAALEAVAKAGYPYSVQWSLDTRDWEHPASDVIINRIITGASNGDIILMHIGGKNTAEAVEKVIPLLTNKGYRLVTLSDVL